MGGARTTSPGGLARTTSPGGLALATCAGLGVVTLLTAAVEAAGWHKYRVLRGPAPDEGLVIRADMWCGNLTGALGTALAATFLLLVLWLGEMRGLADTVWPEGQRRHRFWAFFGWMVPVAQLFVPKMFVNDLWAAAQAPERRRRGSPLLTVWWLAMLLTVNQLLEGHTPLKRAGTAAATHRALHGMLFPDATLVTAAALTATVVWRLSRALRHRTVPVA